MKVSIFITCLTDQFYPRAGQAMVMVLEKLGCEVDFPEEQTCCGQPMYNAGCHRDAAGLARRMADVFQDSAYVVTPSGSCCAMVREGYENLAHEYPDTCSPCTGLISKTYEFTEFLLKVLKVDLKSLGCRWPGSVVYHYSCHLRGLGMKDEALTLLEQIEDLETKPLERSDQCCGFGGIFAVKYPTISGAMTQDKISCIARSGAGTLVCNDGGCALNITGLMHRQKINMRTKHIAEIIAEGLGLLAHE